MKYKSPQEILEVISEKHLFSAGERNVYIADTNQEALATLLFELMKDVEELKQQLGTVDGRVYELQRVATKKRMNENPFETHSFD